jgi:hypothetical protein
VRRKGSGRAAERGHGQWPSGRPAKGKQRRARGKGKEGADVRGRPGSEGEGESWLLGFGKEFGPGKREERRSPQEREKDLGQRWPTRVEEGERRPEREKGRGVLGWARCSPFFSFLLSFFFSTLKPLKQIHLNSNKFEFKTKKLHTNKTMLQHECTSKLML